MPLMNGRDVHIDAVLSNVMVGRRPAGFIADQLVPIIPVGKQSNVYYKSNYKENLMWVDGLDRRAKGNESREIYWSVSSDTYFAQNFALGTKWYGEDVVNADDPIKLRQRSARLVTDRLLLSYEMRIAQLLGTTTNVFTTTHVATAWSNTTGSRVFDDLMTYRENFRVATTLIPNTVVIPEEVMTYVRRNDQIRDILFGDRGGVPTNEQIAVLLGVGKVLVPTVFVNTAGVGETMIGSGNLNAAWPKKVLFAYVGDLTSGEESDTWVNAFRWTDPQFGTPWAIRAFPYNDKKRSQKVEAAYYQAEKVVSPELGYVVDSVI
jgi:hypothetical protein